MNSVANAPEIQEATGRFRSGTMTMQAIPVPVEQIGAHPATPTYDLRDVASLAFRRMWPCP